MQYKKYSTIYPLKRIWDRIYLSNDSIKPTQSYSYYKILFHSFYLHIKEHVRRKMIFHYFNSSDGECIIPLVIYNKKKIITGISNYQRLDYEDIITSTTNTSFLTECFHLIKNEYTNYKINIENINQNSSYYTLFNKFMQVSDTCISIDTLGNYDKYLSSLSKHQRQNIRTAYNKISKNNFAIKLERYDKNRPIPSSIWKACLRIYDERHNFSYSIIQEWIAHQLNAFTHVLKKADGWQINILFHRNTPIAYMAGLCHSKQQSYYIPRLCINNNYREYSPGILLLTETIQLQIKDNIRYVDLMRGDEPYKTAMGGTPHFNYHLNCMLNDLLH